jgi:hypothetical protein
MAARPRRIDDDMTDLASGAVRSAQRAATRNDSAAHPGADTDVGKVGAIGRLRFGQRGRGPVVYDQAAAPAAPDISADRRTPGHDGRLGQAVTLPSGPTVGTDATPTPAIVPPALARAICSRSIARSAATPGPHHGSTIQ